jgi:hypothetical protein
MSSKLGSVVFASVAAFMVGGAGSAVSADEKPAASASACSGAMPPGLTAPAGNGLAFELAAEGVQIYSCADSSGSGPAWALQAPEATLTDPGGVKAGTHRAGPTWEALDGSTVVGAKVAAGPTDPAAVPWLLLRAASHGGGQGRMADVTFVQRIQTSGGVAPSQGCSTSTVGTVARVPYRALYCFYRSEGVPPHGQSKIPTRGSRP